MVREKRKKEKVIYVILVTGDEETQMTRLYDNRSELLRTHPGSTIVFKCDQGVFQCMYICLAPLRESFLAGCRQIVSLD